MRAPLGGPLQPVHRWGRSGRGVGAPLAVTLVARWPCRAGVV